MVDTCAASAYPVIFAITCNPSSRALSPLTNTSAAAPSLPKQTDLQELRNYIAFRTTVSC